MDREKHDRIVAAATKCFVEHGFKRASIGEIAKVAGVGKGTVYLACESKADLFFQAVHADLLAWSAQIARYVDPRNSAAEILHTMADAGVRYLAEHPLVVDLFTGVHAGVLPDYRERFTELRAMGRSTVADVLRLGIRQGDFRADINVDEIAHIIQDVQHAFYMYYGREWAAEPGVARRRFDVLIDLYLNGLNAPGEGVV